MISEIKFTWANKLAFFLLIALPIFTTIVYGAVHQPIIALVYIITSVILLLWAYDAFSSGAFRINKSLIQIPIYLFFLYGMIQIIPFGAREIAGLGDVPKTLSIEPFWTRLTSFHILSLALIFSMYLVFFDSARRIRKIVLTFTIFGFIYSFFAILQSFLSPSKIYGIYEAAFAAPFGSFVNRHNFAAFIEMSIALPLGLLFVGALHKDKRLLYFTAIGLMGIALLLSGSRGGLVALLCEIFFLAIVASTNRTKKQFILKVVFAIALVAAIIGGSIFVGGESSLTRFSDSAKSENLTANRTHIWTVTIEAIKDYPIFGAGIGAFVPAYAKNDTFNGTERVEQAHNDYLQVWADAGIVGVIIGGLFLFLLVKAGRKSLSSQNLYRRGVVAGALGGCFAVLVHSLFDFVLHTTAISLMFLMLVALVVRSGDSFADDSDERLERHQRRKKKRPASVTPINSGRNRLSDSGASV